MTKERARDRMLVAGLSAIEADYYISTYPPEDWPEIVRWANAPPSLDACDDYEADTHHGDRS